MTNTPTACAANTHEYDFARIEPKWQQYWETQGTFRASDDPAAGPKYYALDMFPYPSGSGLHIGHPEGYTATDILARMKKAQGYNVLHPMGWDAFGLPAEQHALATGIPPAVNTAQNIANFKRQIKSLGFGLDWSREIDSTDPQYYRWTQWIFLQLFKRGLAYVDEKPVWWCEALGTVLANEEVIDGRSERGNHPVERRPLRQWVLRITAHAERLLKGLEDLSWPESTKRQQVAWIGKSEGTQVHFGLVLPQADPAPQAPAPLSMLSVYTTCVHTLMGVTFICLAPEHPLAAQVAADPSLPQQQALDPYIRQAASKSDLDRSSASDAQKTGVFTGLYARHPITQQAIPIWVADYVLPHYGTGAVMGVPAHDARDFAFARRYDLPIQPVVANPDGTPATLPYADEGPLVHSGPYDGLWPHEAKQRITQELTQKGLGQGTTQYKLRDWLFSRQRYWGEPFPIVWVGQEAYNAVLADPHSPWQESLPQAPVTFQDKDGQVYYALGLPSQQLPLTLPEVSSYQPSGTGQSPLAAQTDWVRVALHVPSGALVPAHQAPQEPGWFAATRETNTMPQWAASSWYYLRYLDPHNTRALVDPAKERYWGSPDIYIGGAEHAVLHLLYARFWHQVLFDIGVVSQPEPFQRVVHQGLILGQVEFSVFENKDQQPVSVQYVSDSSTDLRDQGILMANKIDSEAVIKKGDVFVLRENPEIQVEAKAYKMSKSRGNVVSPDSIIQTHGADALRLYEMFLGPLEASKPWSTHGIEGISRFLKKIWREYTDRQGQVNPKIQAQGPERADTERLLHETIQKVTEDTEHLRFNTAISQMMVFMNHVQSVPTWSRHSAKVFLQLLAPYAPHIAEELWARLGHTGSICREPWPRADASKLVSSQVTVIVQVNGKLRGELAVAADAPEGFVLQLAHGNSKIAPWIEGKTLLKTIYVPGKILNLVVQA